MKKILAYAGLLVLVSLLFAGFFWLYEVRFFVGRAEPIQSVSSENSYLFVSPLQAKAGGEEKIRVTVFLLNNKGLGVPGRRVSVVGESSLSIESVQRVTDSFGKVVFDVASTSPGEYFLEVRVEDSSFGEKAHVRFY